MDGRRSRGSRHARSAPCGAQPLPPAAAPDPTDARPRPRLAAPGPSARALPRSGVVDWLRSRLNDRPLRADRSAGSCTTSRPAASTGSTCGSSSSSSWPSLGLRVFRLAEPYQMHFDEVYHARTATEFLQDWRYGISHDIYEWTHPHLAKYAMAGGIVAWGDDRVSATSDLGVPVRDALIEPRRDDPALPGGRAGDRVHVVTGTELRSYDLLTREPVFAASVPGAVALTIDPVLERLFIGTTDGKILTFDLYSLDGVTSIETSGLVGSPQAFGQVDGSIRQMYATDDGQSLLVATDDERLTTLDADSAEPIGTIDLTGISGFAPGGTGPVVSASGGAVEDPAAAARVLADLLGGDAATYETRLRSTAESTIVAGVGGVDQKANVDKAIARRPARRHDDRDASPSRDRGRGRRDVRRGGNGRRGDIDRHRRRRARPRLRQHRRREALCHDRWDRRRRARWRRDHRGGRRSGEERSRAPANAPLPGRRKPCRLGRGLADGPRPRADPDGAGSTIYVIEPHAERRLRRRPPAVRAVGLGGGRRPGVPERRPPADPRVRR